MKKGVVYMWFISTLNYERNNDQKYELINTTLLFQIRSNYPHGNKIVFLKKIDRERIVNLMTTMGLVFKRKKTD
jgi:hypothetical protein